MSLFVVWRSGGIDPASRTVNHGETTTFTVTPNTGYSIDSVSGCGGSLSGNTYTTGVISAACTVSASFSATGPTAPLNDTGITACGDYAYDGGSGAALTTTTWTAPPPVPQRR